MPVITFWSNSEKAIGQTVAASLAATVTAMEHNYKVLLISANFNDNVIEECFGAQESNREIVKSLVQKTQINLDSGINGLLKLADSNRVTPEVIHDYTKIVFKNRLEILYSPMNVEEKNKEHLMEEMKNIIMNAARYYDYVFVDLAKGIKYNSQSEILDLSDVVVGNIDQKLSTITELLKLEEFNKIYNKFIWNICKYDKNSKYNLKNLSRTILKKQTVCQTDYNSLILDATQEGGIAELLLRLRTIKVDDESLNFVSNIKKMVEAIMLKNQEMRYKM